jgi:hypothetical protein
LEKVKENIESIFYKVLKKKISVEYFEQWVYENKSLEHKLPKDSYLELISINFKDKFALIEIERVVKQFVNFGKIETNKIKSYLESIISRDENAADSIYMTYELYGRGYDFFRKLGLKYGLLIACPPAGNYIKSFEKISTEEQDELLNEIYPTIIEDAENVLFWINSNQIIITNKVDELGYFEFEDNRSFEETLKSAF